MISLETLNTITPHTQKCPTTRAWRSRRFICSSQRSILRRRLNSSINVTITTRAGFRTLLCQCQSVYASMKRNGCSVCSVLLSRLLRQAIAFWPMEYFSTPSGQEFLSEYFGPPSPTMTPGCMSYTPSSSSMDDDSSNVFDMQFGDALDYSSLSDPERSFRQSHLTYLERLDSSSSSGPSSPATSDSQEYKYIRSSRRSPTRTPSPSCSENGSSSSDHRRRFPCLLAGCSRRFTSQYTLRVHMEAHKPKPKVYFPCTEGCSERFSRQHDRLRHEVSKHGKVCEFSCEECGRFFSSSKTLGNHKCPFAQGATRWVHS
ncbi:hypothetical protein BT96DRAFT_262373 [Gymnopus androsaceus JB14]|uniref:C2H2-type domain-containing protein n=1 Tax=Gymnopus androsaceus JB14 TaxID=1447944 RepID=A0A6A4H4V8_9AGAR|nr:hypothetical protein BT96DRAFT_262373 [Gymnopus androsaceus JB14]